MAQNGGGDVANRVLEAQELLQEMTEDKQIGGKDLQRYLQRKDGIVGTGQHHGKRIVSRGQIMGDLQTFIGKFGS